MIGLDSNCFLRWLVEDDPDQAKIVDRTLTEGAGDLYINLVVLAEVVWVMRNRVGLDRPAIVELLNRLLTHERIVVSNCREVEAATLAFAAGGEGFADHLIGALNAAAGCTTTLTFDKRAARSPHFTTLS